MSATKRSMIVLNLPRAVALLIVYGRHIVQMMTNNTWLPTPSPTLAATTADLDALEDAEATAQGNGKGAAAARDLKKRVVVNDVMGLAAYTMWIANLDPVQAQAIIESAGFAVRQFRKLQKALLAAMMGPTPGQAIVRAKAVPLKKHASYEWQYSSDGGKTWLAMGTTTVADTSVQGLTVGVTYLFRFRTTVGRTTSDWSQPVSLFVH